MKPPLLTDFANFDLGVDDSSSDYADYNAQLKKRRELLNELEARSEGEIGDLDASQESLGELIPQGSSLVGKPVEPKQSSKSRYGAQSKPQFHLSNRKDAKPAVGYEGGAERTASAYDYNDFEDSTDMVPSAQKHMTVKDYDQPIYDSKEDPIPKTKKKGPGGGRGVAMSGESFGGQNPMIHSSGGMHDAIKNAKNGKTRGDRIPEDFLEQFDDDN